MTKASVFFSIALAALLVSCASALKKECEATNWFEHGYKVAMSGKRLNSDGFSASCRKEEVRVSDAELDLGFKAGMQNYCKPEVVFATGKDGQPLNLDFCNPSDEKMLKYKHAEGVDVFCQAGNGYPIGASGRVYNQICPKKLESAFLKEYRRGRRIYLDHEVAGKEHQILDFDRQVMDQEMKRSNVSGQAIGLQPPVRAISWGENAAARAANDAEYDRRMREYQDQKQRLQWEISDADREIRSIRENQKKLRVEITKIKEERDALAP